jgi:VWFA-related protein
MGTRPIPVIGVSVFVFASALAAQQPPTQDPQQTFRSRVTVVPVDVRVVDRNGKPITDLKQEDFTVIEDGVPQKIVHFSFQTLTPVTGEVPDTPLDFRKPLGESVAPQNRRIFLLVLGTGRQVGPVKGVEAAMKFMKQRLLPQDQVAILAYNRATDFTTDHKKALETLQRYWDKHEWIESRLRHHFSGLAATYASREIPPHIQKEVDAVFRVPGALTSRSLAATGVTDAAQIASDTRRTRDQIQRAELAADRLANNMGTAFDQSAVDEAMLNDVSFDEYIEKTSDTMADLGRLYGGIRYLRYLDGEKHLVFLTPNGLFLPRLENSNSIAALANDARVSIDIIHTYGMAGGSAPPVRLPASGPAAAQRALNSAVPSAGVIFTQRFSVGSSRQISDLTGGTTTAFAAGDQAFRRLDESTRAQYLLGYSPTNGNWNGAYRRITVKVNRKDARVLYRHGYAARQEIKPLSRREYLTYSRIASAANMPRAIDDLKMQVGQTAVQTTPEGKALSVDLRIQPGAVKFTRQDDGYVAKIEALYFCADAKEQLVGENWQTLDFKLTEENYQKFMREGVGYTIRVPLNGEPKYLKVILYDYAADLVGSSMVQLKK